MEILAFDSWDDREGDVGLRDAWLASHGYLADRETASLQAYCNLCNQATPFKLHGDGAGEPDLREALVCQRCGCNSRIRGALWLLLERLPPAESARPDGLRRFWRGEETVGPRVYLTEQATPTFVWAQKNLNAVVLGSEYEHSALRRAQLGLALTRMGGRGTVQFQDITRLDFGTATLDAVVSFDVLEHVPDYSTAIGEFARVLKRGGLCVATFPFNDRPHTLVRARITADGGTEHIEPPEYHGDPISGGILCYYHFGWDILDRFHDAGFTEARMVMPFSLKAGLPYGMWTLLARR